MDEARLHATTLSRPCCCAIKCDDVKEDPTSTLEPDQCCRCCLCCKQKCGFISMVIVSGSQVALLTTAGLKTFAFGCENLAMTGGLLLLFWCIFRRHLKASVDLCCRAALTGICGYISFFVGTLANYLPLGGYLIGSVLVVGLCFGSCYMFLRAETWARLVAETNLLHATEKEKDGIPETRPASDPFLLYPPRTEDGGSTEDMDFPGYHMPAYFGLGSWRFSGARIGWSGALVSLCLFLGMFSGLMDMAGDLALLANMRSVLSVSAAVFMKAFFRDALLTTLFYYIMCCYVRALRRRQDWKIGEILMMTVWLSASVGMFQNTVFVMTGSLDGFLIAQFPPWVRGLVVVPGHCFPALVLTLGVVQMYTVKRTTRAAVGVLMLHFWVPVLMFTGINWMINLTGILSDLYTSGACVVLSFVVNPSIFVFTYYKWQRERHYGEYPENLSLPPRSKRISCVLVPEQELQGPKERRRSEQKSPTHTPHSEDDSPRHSLEDIVPVVVLHDGTEQLD